MMKKMIFCSALAMIFSAGAFAAEGKAPAALKHGCGDCPMHKKEGLKKCTGSKMCPETITGVKTVSKNTENGVEITMTAAGKETIARVQELTVVHYGNKETMSRDCPGRVEGAEARIENTADGAKVFLTGKTADVINKIQAASAREHMNAPTVKKEGKITAKASRKYTCRMKCAEADKPGKCPGCGMQMEEKK